MPERRGAASIAVALAFSSSLGVRPCGAWPEDVAAAIARDAHRLLPKTLARLLRERESEIARVVRETPPKIEATVFPGLTRAELDERAWRAFRDDMRDVSAQLRKEKLSAALIALGARHRVVASLADPALTLEPRRGAPLGQARDEFYAFVALHRDKFPIVIEDPQVLDLRSDSLPAHFAGQRGSIRSAAHLLVSELMKGPRVTPAAEVDLRSPVFAVASSSYSRAVVAVATYWFAVWREAGGDVRDRPRPVTIRPGV